MTAVAQSSIPAADAPAILADSFGWPGWVRTVSPFAHVADVPAAPVDARCTVTLLIVACVLGSAGVLRYAKLDLQG